MILVGAVLLTSRPEAPQATGEAGPRPAP
jgi:hypothetical protein